VYVITALYIGPLGVWFYNKYGRPAKPAPRTIEMGGHGEHSGHGHHSMPTGDSGEGGEGGMSHGECKSVRARSGHSSSCPCIRSLPLQGQPILGHRVCRGDALRRWVRAGGHCRRMARLRHRGHNQPKVHMARVADRLRFCTPVWHRVSVLFYRAHVGPLMAGHGMEGDQGGRRQPHEL